MPGAEVTQLLAGFGQDLRPDGRLLCPIDSSEGVVLAQNRIGRGGLLLPDVPLGPVAVRIPGRVADPLQGLAALLGRAREQQVLGLRVVSKVWRTNQGRIRVPWQAFLRPQDTKTTETTVHPSPQTAIGEVEPERGQCASMGVLGLLVVSHEPYLEGEHL